MEDGTDGIGAGTRGRSRRDRHRVRAGTDRRGGDGRDRREARADRARDPDGGDPRDAGDPRLRRRRDDHRPALSTMALAELLAGLKAEAAAEERPSSTRRRARRSARIVAAARSEAQTSAGGSGSRKSEDELRARGGAAAAHALALAAAAALRQAREEPFASALGGGARDGSRLFARRLELSQRCCARCCARAWRRCPPRPCCASTRATSGSAARSGCRARPRRWRSSADSWTRPGGVEARRIGADRAVRNTVEERLANAEPALRLLFGRSSRGQHEPRRRGADFR